MSRTRERRWHQIRRVPGIGPVDVAEIWSRHRGRCAICSQPVSLREAQLHHRIPRAAVEAFYVARHREVQREVVHAQENLAPAHPICNRTQSWH